MALNRLDILCFSAHKYLLKICCYPEVKWYMQIILKSLCAPKRKPTQLQNPNIINKLIIQEIIIIYLWWFTLLLIVVLIITLEQPCIKLYPNVHLIVEFNLLHKNSLSLCFLTSPTHDWTPLNFVSLLGKQTMMQPTWPAKKQTNWSPQKSLKIPAAAQPCAICTLPLVSPQPQNI